MRNGFLLKQQQNRTPRTFSYLRVSTTFQDNEKNKAEILALANAKRLGNVEFFEEKVSGKIPWRNRKIAEILEIADKGDNVVISELSRLGRSMLEIMEILAVASQKGINIYAIKGNWELNNTIQSKLIAMCFSMASEIERDLISKRITEALQAKKAQGLKLGRPRGVGRSKLDKYRIEIELLLKNGSSQRFISARYGCTEGNLYHWMKQHNISKLTVQEEMTQNV